MLSFQIHQKTLCMTSFRRQNDETRQYLKTASFFFKTSESLLTRLYVCAKFDLVCVKVSEVMEGDVESPLPVYASF